MKPVKERRAKMMDYLCQVMNILDPTGDNAKAYQENFGKMSDAEFDKFIRNFFDDPKANLYLEVIEFERDVKFENIEKCAKFMKVPLLEHVAIPYVTGDPDNVVVTPEPVPVGYIHEKRMQQTLLKKNSGSISTSKRNPKTGQVVGDDKNSKNSDVETYSLIAIGADAALRELMGPRADDLVDKNIMINKISKDGFFSLEDLINDPENKVALNTLDVYFRMQGFATNLVVPLTVIPKPKKKGR